MPLLHIVLRATKEELNMDRVYEIYLDKGLFKKWIVMTAYGPYHGGRNQRIYSFSTVDEARNHIDKLLHQKLNSEKRIGSDYKIVSWREN